MSKKKYEDMSFDELQEAYIKEYCAEKKATERIEKLQVAIDETGEKYKKLQAEMRELLGDVKSSRGMIPECSVILDEIGKMIVRVGAPQTEDPETEDPDTEDPEEDPEPEKKSVKRTRRNRADNDS